MKKKQKSTIRQTLGQRVRFYRTRDGLTQEALAVKSGFSTNFVAHLERGTRGAGLDTIERFARLFKVAVADLLIAS